MQSEVSPDAGTSAADVQRISVLIPARNASASLAGTLESLLPVKDLIGEVVVTDDGSTDGTAETALSIGAQTGLPVTVVSGRLAGVGAARNVAFQASSCPLVLFMDADDHIIGPGLRRLHQALTADPAAMLAIGGAMDARPGQVSYYPPGAFGQDLAANAEGLLSYRLNLVRPGAGLGRRALMEKRRFPEGVPIGEDVLYWASLLRLGAVATVDEAVVTYFIDESRYDARYLKAPSRDFLAYARAARRVGVSRPALREAQGKLATWALRRLIAAGRTHQAKRFLQLGLAARLPRHDRIELLKVVVRARYWPALPVLTGRGMPRRRRG